MDGVSDAVPTTFADLELRPELLEALTTLGYEEPTPIQAAAIAPLIAGRDLLGQAATGTGKTAAFALPLLQRLDGPRAESKPAAIVLTPTRELTMQVSEAIHKYGRGIGARVVPVFGGQPIFRQIKALERGVDVVVATPGRALDLLKRNALKLDAVATVVLDEADEMLDMGFAEDIEAILETLPKTRQTVLFSATMPDRIEKLARRHQNSPERIELAGGPTGTGSDELLVTERAYVVHRNFKPAALGRVLDLEAPGAALVFCRTRDEVDSLTETLNGRGYRAEALHGGLSQEQRTKVVGRLKNQTSELLIATDVAARGLDVDVLTHVVNYDVPSAPEAYVHRIGRVGRAGREGVAITLAQPREHRLLKAIERTTGRRISVEPLPTVADLRARRMELTQGTLREAITAGELDALRPVVESLCEEFDVMEVALAAVKVAHASLAPAEADERDVPEATFGKAPRRDEHPGKQRARDRGERDERRPKGRKREFEDEQGAFADRGERPERGSGHPGGRDRKPLRSFNGDGSTARLFVGAGKAAGVRPQDLVGAITGESDLKGHDIGAIAVHDRFALVEVPSASVDAVVEALRGTKIKGNRPTIRRDRF